MFRVALGALIIFFMMTPVAAQVDNDFQSWSLVTVKKKLDEKWAMHFELQNRLSNNISHEGLLFIRPALSYKLSSYSSIWQGYAWIPNFASGSLVNEHRLWQQIDFSKKINKFDVFAWMRLEERFLEDIDAVSVRDRFRLGFKYPIFDSKTWKFVAFDELFINFFDAVNDSAGFDQNWTFVGLEKTFNKNTSLNFGYVANYLDRDPDQLQHALRVHLDISL